MTQLRMSGASVMVMLSVVTSRTRPSGLTTKVSVSSPPLTLRPLRDAQELAKLTRREVASRLRLEGEALASLLRSVPNRFDLSLQSALREA